jgi:hypothetical protein
VEFRSPRLGEADHDALLACGCWAAPTAASNEPNVRRTVLTLGHDVSSSKLQSVRVAGRPTKNSNVRSALTTPAGVQGLPS